MPKRLLRVLVVDDSVMYRKVLSDVLSNIPGIEVVGTATDGKVALAKIPQLKPDMLTLDFDMPELDGLKVLERVRAEYPDLKTVMVSTHTKEGAAVTLKALELGALTFITKPRTENPLESRTVLFEQLAPVIKEIRDQIHSSYHLAPDLFDNRDQVISQFSMGDAEPEKIPSPAGSARIQIVAIGISTGGPKALAELIPCLPETLRIPVVIVQHMPSDFTAALAESLDQKSAVKVVEAQNNMVLERGTVFIAPGGRQMKVVNISGQSMIEVNDDPPENHCQPSVDYLFRSVSKVYGKHALGIIMTGMGSDGVLGLRLMKRLGAQVIAQNRQSCVVFGMPGEAINAGVVDCVVPLNQIATQILQRVGV
ncbi:MAG: chemotaxis response regulator protein-glutamate methylesterase [Proteobacteria bacterium]|nr:chemotaxis response regulator protein-glutamate methylesterase [Pseudomonadota bacterium]MBU1388354.1 chemotaxis response regulator protein-glutamate methylesterase [Pseudomonadota bacterium]MBU1542822.1 chemotaxis response regulator protein-glutamate methylesterase [Pseudomonadota bacterium]MBU2430248.1 chemotaxis response regulator protein-glutamate methylesterase [Pseudomonadota bacterium]MBU2481846.1 chemotaxis response regulator protein-glutamate methylesterase [Pseudomonadota bacterium